MAYPQLVIAADIKKVVDYYMSKGYLVHDIPDLDFLRQFITEVRFLSAEAKPIVFRDLATFGGKTHLLLKLMEECKAPLICLSSEDNVPAVLLSRFAVVKKYPILISQDTDTPSSILEMLDGHNKSVPAAALVATAPSAISLVLSLNRVRLPVKSKIAQVLFGGSN
jgi:hypothetical protein